MAVASLFTPDKEIFQNELAIHRRQRVFADPAMDQSMREVGVCFHTDELIARPAARAHKLGRMILSHSPTPQQSPTEAAERMHPPNGVIFRARLRWRRSPRAGDGNKVAGAIGSPNWGVGRWSVRPDLPQIVAVKRPTTNMTTEVDDHHFSSLVHV
jgi:hypothetical protein